MVRRLEKKAHPSRRLSLEPLERRLLLSTNVWSWGELQNSATGGGLSNDAVDSIRPAVAVLDYDEDLYPDLFEANPDGLQFVAWAQKSAAGGSIAWKMWDGETWTDTHIVSDPNLDMSEPQLAATINGQAFLSFEAFNRTLGCYEVYLEQIYGDPFSVNIGNFLATLDTPVPVSNPLQADRSNARHPSMASDTAGDLFLVWQDDVLGHSDIFGFFGKWDKDAESFDWVNLQVDPAFFAQQPGARSNAVASVNGRFDQDNLLDVVVANAGTHSLSVFLGQVPTVAQPGNFKAPTTVTLNFGGPDPSGLARGDFNRDGRQDLVVISADAGGFVMVQNGGAGNFTQLGTLTAIGAKPTDLAMGDLNGDGAADLVLAASAGDNSRVEIWLADNSGATPQLVLSQTIPVSDPAAIDLADINGDGGLDIAVASAGGTVSVIFGTLVGGQPNGQFGTAQSAPSLAQGLNDIAAADFNGDGQLDLAVLNGSLGSVSILINGGGTTFTPGQTIGGFDTPVVLQTGLINGDSVPDLIVQAYARFYTLAGAGDGTFALPDPSTNATQTSVFSIDMNLAVAEGVHGTDNVIVLSDVYATSYFTVYTNDGTGQFSYDRDYYVQQAAGQFRPGIAGPGYAAYSPAVAATGTTPVVVWQNVPIDSNDPLDPDNRAQLSDSSLYWRSLSFGTVNNRTVVTWNNLTTVLPINVGHPGFNPALGGGSGRLYVAYESEYNGSRIYVKQFGGSGWTEILATEKPPIEGPAVDNGITPTPVEVRSATGVGISNIPYAIEPAVALDFDGRVTVTWATKRTSLTTDDYEIYIRRLDRNQWEDVGFNTTTFTGISADGGPSRHPAIAIGQFDGQIYVAWDSAPPRVGDTEIFLRTRSQISDRIYWHGTVNGVNITIYYPEGAQPADPLQVAVGRGQFKPPASDTYTPPPNVVPSDILILPGSGRNTLASIQLFTTITDLGFVIENCVSVGEFVDKTMERVIDKVDPNSGERQTLWTGGVQVAFIACQGSIKTLRVASFDLQEMNAEVLGSGWVTPRDIDQDYVSTMVIERPQTVLPFYGSRYDEQSVYFLGGTNDFYVNVDVAADMYFGGDVKRIQIFDNVLGDIYAGSLKSFEALDLDVVNMIVAGKLGSLKVNSFLGGFLIAGEIGTITSEKNFMPAIQSGAGVKKIQVNTGYLGGQWLQVGDNIGAIDALGTGALLSIYSLPQYRINIGSIRSNGPWEGDMVVDGIISKVTVNYGDARIEDIQAARLNTLSVMNGRLLSDRYDVAEQIGKITVNGGQYYLNDRILTPKLGSLSVSGGDFILNGTIFADQIGSIRVSQGGFYTLSPNPIIIDERVANQRVRIGTIDVQGDLTGDIVHVGKLSRVSVRNGSIQGNISADDIGSIIVDGSVTGRIEALQKQIASLATGGAFAGALAAVTGIGRVSIGQDFAGTADVTAGRLGTFIAGRGIAGTITAPTIGAVQASNGSFHGLVNATAGGLSSLTVRNGDFIGDAVVQGLLGRFTVDRGNLSGDIEALAAGTMTVSGSIVDDSDGQPALNVTTNVKSLSVNGGNISGVQMIVGGLFGSLTVNGGNLSAVNVQAEILNKLSVTSGQTGGNIFDSTFTLSEALGTATVKGNADKVAILAPSVTSFSVGGRLLSADFSVENWLGTLAVASDVVAPEIQAGQIGTVDVRGSILSDGVNGGFFIQSTTGTWRVRALNVSNQYEVVFTQNQFVLDDGRVVLQVL